MTTRRPRLFVIAALALVLAAATAARAQETLAKAKDFYATAAYEEALQVLKNLKGAGNEATEVAAYQVFGLYALGRSDEAKKAIESIVRADPLFRPSDAQVSPRVRAFFEDVRRPLLPEVVRQSYTRAKDAYDRKDHGIALGEFDRVITLLDELSAADDQGVADLRTLAAGFRDLSKAAVAPPPPPAPEAAPPVVATPAPAPVSTAAPERPAQTRIYTVGDTDVRRPVVMSQTLPPWRPESPVEERQSFSGVIELVVGEDGKVITATIVRPVHARYDAALLKAAHAWRYRPATKDGKPVRYRLGMNVHLGR